MKMQRAKCNLEDRMPVLVMMFAEVRSATLSIVDLIVVRIVTPMEIGNVMKMNEMVVKNKQSHEVYQRRRFLVENWIK